MKIDARTFTTLFINKIELQYILDTCNLGDAVITADMETKAADVLAHVKDDQVFQLSVYAVEIKDDEHSVQA